jgi:outer membrane immunogenic protein
MKRTLMGGVASLTLLAVSSLNTASAADLAPPAPTPAWSWTGFYVGLQGGAGWGTDEDQVTGLQVCPMGGACGMVFPAAFSQSSFAISGMFGGATVGYNWQRGPVVLGVEGDFSGSSISGSSDCQDSFGLGSLFAPSSACKTTMDWFATADARLGVAVDHALLYVKGGAAWAHLDHSEQIGTNLFPATPLYASGSVSNTPMGFNFGAGIEYALWSGWSAKVEYDYIDFGNSTIKMPLSVPQPGQSYSETATDHVTVNLVRAGLNFRFN